MKVWLSEQLKLLRKLVEIYPEMMKTYILFEDACYCNQYRVATSKNLSLSYFFKAAEDFGL